VAISALLKEDIDVDFRQAFDTKAVVLSVEQRQGKEDMAVAHAAGRTPPFIISRDVSVLSLEDEARKRGSLYPFFEDPIDREVRVIVFAL
jgi:hypothetical protein